MRSLVFVMLGLPLALTEYARADSWCAAPLTVHEWGVYVIGDDPRAHLGESSVWPDWLYTPEKLRQSSTRVPVRLLPADKGIRRLPILHFYGSVGGATTIPVGVEVGFAWGSPFVWYPRVDALVPGPRALVWDRLELGNTPAVPPRPTPVPWVQQARSVDKALWVDGPDESERFVFYEATSRQEGALVLRRGPGYRPGQREVELENRSAFPVHDIFVIHRDARAGAFLAVVPTLAAHATTTLVLDEHPVAAGGSPPNVLASAGAAEMRKRWSVAAPSSPRPPDACVMNRKPAEPFDEADDYHIYSAELDLLLSVWAERFFARPGTTVVYREDAAQLDAAMPLAIFTDMFHYVRLARLGLVVQPAVQLFAQQSDPQ